MVTRDFGSPATCPGFVNVMSVFATVTYVLSVSGAVGIWGRCAIRVWPSGT